MARFLLMQCHCGKEFKVAPSAYRRGEGKYCSKSCVQKAKQNPDILPAKILREFSGLGGW